MTEVVERTVHTSTAPDIVAEYLADFRNAAEWDSGTVSCDLVSGDGGPGSHYRNVSRFAGREVELDYVLDEASPERIRLTGRAGPTTAHDTITIRPDGAGGTQVDYHAEFEFGLAARLAAPVVRLLLDRLADDTAATLAAALDARAAHSSQLSRPMAEPTRSPGKTSLANDGFAARIFGDASDQALDLLVAPGFTRIGSALRERLPGYPEDPTPGALEGRHIAITGASSGLGAATAHGVSALGAHVHLIVRDVAKGQAVADALPGPSSVWQCDIGDLTSVAAFTREFRSGGAQLAGLVHNAGAMPAAYEQSPQGHELTMSLHVLGPIAMTDALAPVLHDARVVFVTSGGMYLQQLRADDPEYRAEDYRPTRAYARSKRAQVELLPDLQERWGDFGISVSAMHPGWSDTPGLSDSLPGFARLTGPLLRSPDDGADTIVWLLARPEDGPRARLWHDRRVRPTSRFPVRAATPEQRAQLLTWVEGALGG